MDFGERYRVISSRDARFDGRFVTAVRTTGIYCRPSCPARTPKPGNVTFFPTSAAAHEAGYRACKRCLPEAVPGTPEWNLRGDLVGRAMRLITDGVIEREGVPGLAARLGYSSRHLTRVLVAELGAGPRALGRAARAQTARTLLVSTDLRIADVAFAAGFASVRQFNDTISAVFALTPGRLRELGTRRLDARGPGELTLSLPVREPFDAAGVFAWLTSRALAGVEEAGAERYARTVALPGGPGRIDVGGAGPALRLRASVTTLADVPVLVARVRRLFDLDADPLAVDAALGADPAFEATVARVPGIRLPGTVDPAELLIRAIVGQQVSVAGARTTLTRLAALAGERMPGEGPDLLFPTPGRLAALTPEQIGGPRARAATLLAVAAALADGSLPLGVGDDAAEQTARLERVPGIGPWTSGYVRMRVLGDPDVLLTGDGALRVGAARLGLPATPVALASRLANLAPWRSYASMHLWRAAAAAREVPKNVERGARDERISAPRERREKDTA